MKYVRSKRGFTLIEIMVVVALVAVLLAIAVPNYISYRKTAHAKACRENIEMIRTACNAYLVKTGTLETDFSKLSDNNSGKGFLKKEPRCPIGGSYTISVDTRTQIFTITCSMGDDDEHNVNDSAGQ